MTMTKMKKNEEALNTDSEIIPVKKKELMSRLEGEELKYKACYDECVKHAIGAKLVKEEVKLYKDVLETNDQKFKELKNENELLKNELGIYKSKTSKTAHELESKKVQVKSADDFSKDVAEGFSREKERLEKLKKSIEERFLYK